MIYDTPGFKASVDAVEDVVKTHHAFGEGLRAAQNTPNPYTPGTPAYDSWRRGYFSSKEEA